MIYALDANIAIHFIHQEPNVHRMIDNVSLNGSKLVIPTAVDYEVRRGFYVNPNAKRELSYEHLYEKCTLIDLNSRIWQQAMQIYADLRKQGITIGDFDVIIAASCVVNSHILVTTNTKHFENIASLLLENWLEMGE
ncbi:MAG: PIN domain-containing protein [Turicibacter sp.]|nr:PIN domain-containing protein [Turicibacter sp.]